jgi:hypothetical protein
MMEEMEMTEKRLRQMSVLSPDHKDLSDHKEKKGIRGIQVQQDHLVQVVQPDLQVQPVQQVPMDQMVCKVLLEQLAHKVLLEQLAHKVPSD